MSNFQRIADIRRGFVFYTPDSGQTSFPALSYATPGIYARSLYSRYVPFEDPELNGRNSSFCSTKILETSVEQQRHLLTHAKLPEQIGHGLIEEKGEPIKSPSPYDDAKMKQVLEKMQHPVYNVEVVSNAENNSKRKYSGEPAKKCTKESKKMKPEPKYEYHNWY
jgi:hypothetical protein